MLRKTGILILAAALLLQLTGCGSQPEGKTTLKVWGLDTDSKVDKYLTSYMADNPDVRVVIENGISSGSGESAKASPTEALKQLNTELLAGGGPDILIMDDMDAASYIELGLLEDISPLIEEAEGLLPAVTQASRYEKDGKLYAMPAGISLLVEAARTGAQVDFTDSETFLQSLEGQNLNTALWFSNIMAYWYRTEIDPLIQKEGKIDRSRLKDFYETLNRYEDYEPEDDVPRAFFNYDNMTVNPLDEYWNIIYGTEFFSKEGRHKVDAAVDYLHYIKSVQELCHYQREGALQFHFRQNDRGYLYIPMINAAINKNSKNKALAEEYVKYLFSEDGQKLVRENGMLPVNGKITMDEMNQKQPDTFYRNGQEGVEVSAFKDRDIAQISRAFENLSQPLSADASVMEIIMTGAAGYINGELSLDQALDSAMNKLDIYLAE